MRNAIIAAMMVMSYMAICSFKIHKKEYDFSHKQYDFYHRSPFVVFGFYTGFEDADRTAGGRLNLNNVGLSCQPDGMQVVTIQARKGLYSIRSIVRSNDVPLCGNSYRDEFSIFKNGADSIVKDRFVAFSFFPEDYYPGGLVDKRDGLIFQCKSTSQDIFPFIAIWITPDASGLFSKYQLVIQYATTINAPSSAAIVKRVDLGRVYSDKWVDFAMDIDWQFNSTGSIKLYMDGKLVDKGGGYTSQGQNMNPPFNNSAIRYPNNRFGQYWFSWSNPANPRPFAINQKIAYYDEVKVGTAGTITDYITAINIPPTANAGANINITLPTSSTPLNGSGSIDTDGFITTYLWTKKSGPASYSITNPGNQTTTVTGLTAGDYVFGLKVTDNNGASDSSTVAVKVFAATPANIPPTVSAGANEYMILPTNSTTLKGLSTDSDGSIASRLWTKLSGPAATIVTPGSDTTVISNLAVGRYVFQLTATDNLGLTGSKTVEITVDPIPAAPNKTVRLKIRGI